MTLEVCHAKKEKDTPRFHRFENKKNPKEEKDDIGPNRQ